MLGKELRSLTLLMKILFCNPKTTQKKAEIPTVKFLFSESTRLTSVGGEKALAAMIGTLGDSLEKEYGTLVARIFRVFKPHADKTYSGKWRTFCCIPYFVYFYIVLLCLEVCVALLVITAKQDMTKTIESNVTIATHPMNFGQKIESNTGILVTLIIFSVVIGGAFFLNIFTWGQALVAIIWSQKRRIMKASSKLHKLKMDGLMHKLKQEVDIMAKMVINMDRFTENQTRLVVVVDGLDSCEQDKVLQVLDTIKTLFCDEDSPFITILAVDPQIIIKGIESNIKTSFVDSNVNGFDYLRNVVHLPFYLQSQGMAIPKQNLTKGFSQCDVSGESPSKTKIIQHQESTVSSTTVYEIRKKGRKKVNRSDSLSLAGTSNFDITGTFTKNDYFSDVNPRSMRRLLNIVAVTGRLLRAYNIDFSWYRLASWINILEQWPYRTSWIILYYEEKEMMDNNCTLYSIYQKIADKLPVSKEVEPLLEIDRNPRKLEAFLSSKSSSKSNMLTIADLKKFLPCTINLDPYLRKLIRELQKNTDIFRSEFPMNIYPGVSSSGVGPTQQMMAGLSPDQYATPRRIGTMRNPGPANLYQLDRQIPQQVPQYGNMPYYGTQFYGVPYLSQMTPNIKQMPDSPKLTSPDTFIKGYKNERLSTMSVQDVCDLLVKLDGINQTFVPKYQDCVIENNISGLVLVSCDLNELGNVLDMKFGDWQLFKAAVKSLIDKENALSFRRIDLVSEESSGLGASSINSFDSVNTVVSNTSNNKSNKSNGFSKGSGQQTVENQGSANYGMQQTDKSDEFETITEGEELVMLNKRGNMRRNDSILQQMSYESGLLKEAMQSFTEMDEEEEASLDNGICEIQGDITPTESISSILEKEENEKKKRSFPVQFTLRSEHDYDNEIEPLLGATASVHPDFTHKLRKEHHHESLEEIKQIISVEDNAMCGSLSNAPNEQTQKYDLSVYNSGLPKEKLALPLSSERGIEHEKSYESVGFSTETDLSVDSVELVNETERGHLHREKSIEDSIQEFMMDSTQKRSGKTSSSVENVQMITIDKEKDKGPEAFV